MYLLRADSVRKTQRCLGDAGTTFNLEKTSAIAVCPEPHAYARPLGFKQKQCLVVSFRLDSERFRMYFARNNSDQAYVLAQLSSVALCCEGMEHCPPPETLAVTCSGTCSLAS
eukprot:6191271-Pleurochrysis_carterae.AAC.2